MSSDKLKHIPRQWRIEDHGYCITIEPNICLIDNKTAETREKMVALANFIIAAPEMYDFVKMFTTISGQILLRGADNGREIYNEAVRLCKLARGEE